MFFWRKYCFVRYVCVCVCVCVCVLWAMRSSYKQYESTSHKKIICMHKTRYIWCLSRPKVSHGSSFYSKIPLSCCNLKKHKSQYIIHSYACCIFTLLPSEERLTFRERWVSFHSIRLEKSDRHRDGQLLAQGSKARAFRKRREEESLYMWIYSYNWQKYFSHFKFILFSHLFLYHPFEIVVKSIYWINKVLSLSFLWRATQREST